MKKVFGRKECFMPVREDASRVIVSYDYVEETDGANATWYEIDFLKKNGIPDFDDIKKTIIEDINTRTDYAILTGYQWTVLHGDDEGITANVWLSKENQDNFKAEHDAAIQYPDIVTFPLKYKIGEKEDTGEPVYEYFQNISELAQFYLGGLAYIARCYNEGWQKKDNFDFSPYEEILEPSES